MQRRFLILVCLLVPVTAFAQGSVNVTASDSATGTRFQIGDATAKAIHTLIVNASGTVIGSAAVPVRTDPTGTTTQPVSVADGSQVTLGAKADAKSTATDTTSVSIMSVLKQISASVQAPPSQAVTNTGTFATQSAITAASGALASGAVASGAFASGSMAAGACADGCNTTLGAKADAKSTATDTTSITIMQVLKQISASVQAPPSQAVTNAGTFAVQSDVVKNNGVAIASPDANSYPISPVAATATTAAGASACYFTSAASTNANFCKASAGNVYAIHVTNTTTTNYYLRLYNLTAAPTCSSATGFVETIPALGAAANGGVNGRAIPTGQAFSTGIAYCLTGGGSSTDNTNAATGVYVTIDYK